MAKCPECGAENPDEALYCQECYAKITPTETAVKKEVIITSKEESTQEAGGTEEEKPQEVPKEEEEGKEAPPAEEKAISKKDATAGLKEVKKLLKKAKSEGKDIKGAKKEFMAAQPAYKEGDYNKVMEIVNKVKGML